MTREEAIKEIENINNFNYTRAPIEVFDMAIKELEPEPKTGKWEFVCQHWRKCSECGFSHKFAEDWKYCPNCGARMESEVRNEQSAI